MSKLQKQDKFIDLSDYGRPIAKIIAVQLKHTRVTSIHLTLMFAVSGLLGVYCITKSWNFAAAIFLIIKSILDAADGELSRVKNKPSYTGRYLDSIFDIILNLLILIAIYKVTSTNFYWIVLAFIAIQLQGTLYNYYYVILRNKLEGADNTSKVFEYHEPNAFEGESQKAVHITYTIFKFMYARFDKAIHWLDSTAPQGKQMPNWFMTLISIYGLGFQLLLIGFLLVINAKTIILPFFVFYSVFIFVLIAVRKVFLRS